MPTQPPTVPPDLATLAVTLQEAVQALLSLATAIPSDEMEKLGQQDEYRFYRVPFHIQNDEQELLAEYDTDRIAHVFRETYTELYIMLVLMKGYAERNDDEDFTSFLIAQKLFKPLDRLSKACSVIVDFELPIKRASIGGLNYRKPRQQRRGFLFEH